VFQGNQQHSPDMSTFCLLHFLLRTVWQKKILPCQQFSTALENAIRRFEQTRRRQNQMLHISSFFFHFITKPIQVLVIRKWLKCETDYSPYLVSSVRMHKAIPPLPPCALKQWCFNNKDYKLKRKHIFQSDNIPFKNKSRQAVYI